jgi:glycosyltransferase involved in cell wall biosynthesis
MHILYRSIFEPSGYGLAAIAYVRALRNAGVNVTWQPMVWAASGLAPINPQTLAAAQSWTANDASLSDLDALLTPPSLSHATTLPADLCVLHAVPDYWPALRSQARIHVGYAAWESASFPEHFGPFLDGVSALLVPSSFNQGVFAPALRIPVHTVPHIRRHAWNNASPAPRQQLRQQMGISATDTVFYSINDWTARKNIEGLIRAFTNAFTAQDPVVLVLKTHAMAINTQTMQSLSAADYFSQIYATLGPRAPRIQLIAGDTSAHLIDALHSIGSAYVSLTHGEGWGLGAFDAASLGKPVIAPAWGGLRDFMGDHWLGAVQYNEALMRLSPGPDARIGEQIWCAPNEAHASQLMHHFMLDPAPFQSQAVHIRQRVLNRFSEPQIGAQFAALLAQLGAHA